MNSSAYKDVYKQRKKDRDSGIVNGLPLKHIMPDLSKYYPAIVRGEYLLITTFSGVGKTQITKFMTIINAFIYKKINPSYNYKILWFGFEETKQQFYDSFQLYVTYMKHQLRLDMFTLLNVVDDKPITDEMIAVLESNERIVDAMLENVEMYDQITNPYGVHKEIEKYALEHGTIITSDIEIVKSDKNGNPVLDATGNPVTEIIKKRERYEQHDPTLHTMLVFDHISLLTPEKQFGYDKRLTMENFSFDKCRLTYSKLFNFSVIAVQQQAQAEERMQYSTSDNSANINKVKPSLSNLADCKTTQRDCLSALTLFDPHRHHVDSYKGYNLKLLGNNFREIEIVKNRYGSVAVTKCYLFDGANLRFKELPKALDNGEKILDNEAQKIELDAFIRTDVTVLDAYNNLKNKKNVVS